MHGVPRFSATSRSTTAVRSRIDGQSPISSFTSSSIAIAVDAMVRRQPPRELGVRLDEAQRLGEAADAARSGGISSS